MLYAMLIYERNENEKDEYIILKDSSDKKNQFINIFSDACSCTILAH